jgi:hypothetical protein
MLKIIINSILLLTTNVGVKVNSTLMTIGMVKGITIKHELPRIGLVILMVASIGSLYYLETSFIWTLGENILEGPALISSSTCT